MNGYELKEMISVVWNALNLMKFEFIGYTASLAQLIIYGCALIIFVRFIFKLLGN